MKNTRALISEEALVESLLDSGRTKEALSEIDKHRRSLAGCDDTQRISAMFHLHARVFLELGDYRRALLKIKVALRLMRRINDDSGFARMKLTIGRILVRLGCYDRASESFNESYVFYKRVGDFKSIFFPLSDLAQLHYVGGNLNRCRDVLRLCITYATRYGEERDVNIDMRNLAMVLIKMGELHRALSILDSMSGADTTDWEMASIARLRGIVHLQQSNLDIAANLIGQASSSFRAAQSLRDVGICLEYLGLLEFTRGNYARAREYYQKVIDMPEPTASAVAQTLRMLTDVYIAEKKFEIAEETAVKAEAAITKINERIELGALYRAYGQIHTHKQEAESARDNFKKSIDLLREIGARYELALSYFATGKSESYSFDERLRNLEMSRMLFIEMDVPKRVEQVEDVITKLRRDSNVSAASRKADLAAPTIITGDRQVKEILAVVERIKNTSHTVLITGETGTGKDLLAEYIHRSSARANKPFRIVNTAAIPSELLESELFGFRKGTYTGATHDKIGLIESAEGGTFYFDEIGDAPPDVQTKILRVLDTKSVRRLGTTSDIKVDVRFIAATNLDLMQMMESGHFRSDLYYRLQEMPIHLPPLRDRLDDIKLLVEFFLEGTGFDNATTDNGSFDVLLERLNNHSWPGNIRELKFEINRMIALAPGNGIDDLLKVPSATGKTDESISKDATDREQLPEALRRADGNQSRAARELGVPESTLRYQMKKYDI